jgi:hypothetical protein
MKKVILRCENCGSKKIEAATHPESWFGCITTIVIAVIFAIIAVELKWLVFLIALAIGCAVWFWSGSKWKLTCFECGLQWDEKFDELPKNVWLGGEGREDHWKRFEKSDHRDIL